MFFVKPSGHRFVDRGDVSRYDYETGNFTKDDAWHNLDLSIYVPHGAIVIFIDVTLQSPSSAALFQLRTKGNSEVKNRMACRGCVANMDTEYSSFIVPDALRIVEYKCSVDTFNILNLIIRGWLR